MNKNIKSLEELRKIRENASKKVSLRESGENPEGVTEILVGMATCGIAAGARDTMSALFDEIEAQSLKNINVLQVGCLGLCHSEPIVQVNIPGQEPIIYGNVNRQRAKEIIQKHIMNNELIDDAILNKNFDKA